VPPREIPAMTQLRKKGSPVYFGQERIREQRAQLGVGPGLYGVPATMDDLLGTGDRKVETTAVVKAKDHE